MRYRYTVYHRSLHISRSVFSKQSRKDTPWLTCKGEVWEVFRWLIVWSELWLCSACFSSILRNTDCDITRAYSVYWYISEKIVSYICDMMLYFTVISLKLSWKPLCCRLRHHRSNDNFRWRHWHWSWHYDSSRFSTRYAISLYNVLSRDLLSS